MALAASASVALNSFGAALPELETTVEAAEKSPRPGVPLWVKQGIVAASNMEALSFVRRRGGEAANYGEQWRADLCDATVKTLLDQGVNLILVTLFKGAGLKTEANDIAVAREFVQTAHRRGLKVGGYIGGTLFYETLEAEQPRSKEWKQIDEFGHALYYTPAQTFRYMACRNNPEYLAYIKEVIRVGVKDLQMDMIHFDQMMWWTAPASCHCNSCRKQFREFLKSRYPAKLALLRFGFENVDVLNIPPFGSNSVPAFADVKNPLIQEWALFRAWSIAERYKELTDYIHSLNPETAVQGNPTMNLENNVGFLYGVDYGQLLEGGDMVCSEEPNHPEWTDDGRLVSQIRTYKGARSMGKSLWVWQAPVRGFDDTTRKEGAMELGLSEALAYNDRNLGIVAGWDVSSNTIPAEAKPYIDLFYRCKKDLVNTHTVADIAILRSFASISFNPAISNTSTTLFEQSLIQAKIPFAIIFDRHLENLSAYKVLVLADQDALSEAQVASIDRFVRAGGSVVATGSTSLLNEWRLVRPKFALADLLSVDRPPSNRTENVPHRVEVGQGRAVYIPRIEPALAPPLPQVAFAFPNHYWRLPNNHDDLIASIHWAARFRLSAEVDAPPWVTLELARQENGPLLLHLVNFKPKETIRNIKALVRPPARFRVKEAVLVNPEDHTEIKLDLVAAQGGVSMVIPSMSVYALVILRLEKA
ncbi:MAG: beta-galactosidase [Edaphobacter sp.]